MNQRGFFDLEIAGLLFATVLVGSAIFLLMAWFESSACHNKARIMGLQSQWGVTTGCMVKVEGRYVPLGAIRFVDGRMQVDMADSE